MTAPYNRLPVAARSSIAGALAAVLLLAGNPALAKDRDPAGHVEKLVAAGASGEAISVGEAALAAAPRDKDLRTALGHAYLREGRFESAASVLADAQTLGDASAHTALSLALADIAAGRGHDALAVLDAAREGMPVSDYGLALALAGETGRGVAVLGATLRSGDSTPQLRQNLAYAFALDGRWADARLMATFDVPADKLEARLTGWAAHAQPEAYRTRVAALLGVSMRADSGLPQRLALSAAPAANLAVADQVPVPVPVPVPAPVATPVKIAVAEPAPAPAPVELPALANGARAELPPVVAIAIAAVPETRAPVNLAVNAVVPEPAPEAVPAPIPQQFAAAFPSPPPAPHFVEPRADDAAPMAHGDRMVQFGAFISQSNAERARKSFALHNPALHGHVLSITRAVVNGRTFWRVAAGGFDSASAGGLCSSIRGSGGACFAYAEGHAPMGSAPVRTALAVRAPAAHAPIAHAVAHRTAAVTAPPAVAIPGTKGPATRIAAAAHPAPHAPVKGSSAKDGHGALAMSAAHH